VNVTGGGLTSQMQTDILRLFTLLVTQYPWLSSPSFPDPIPAELLVPFSQWVLTNQFTGLTEFFSQLTDNLGDYREVLALYVLPILSPVVLNFFFTPASSFEVKNGCSSIYAGITTFLGQENVYLNATITEVHRKGNGHVQIAGTNNFTGASFRYFCDDVIIAFPQTLTNLDPWDLDATETAIFSQTRVRDYYWGTANITGPSIPNGFNIQFRNLSDPFVTPPYPGLVQILRNDDVAPAAWYAVSSIQPGQEIDSTTMSLKIQNEFNLLTNPPLDLLSSVSITSFHQHQYQPHIENVTALQASPNIYTQIGDLQGYRHTYYVGALTGYSASFIVWENSYNLVQTYFPPPNNHGH